MVNKQQIPLPRAKYELLLSDSRQNRWKHVIAILCSIIIVGLLFSAVYWWLEPLERPAAAAAAAKSSKENTEDDYNAKIAAWIRRARMYAESTKENQNADRNASLAKIQFESNGTAAGNPIIVCYYTIPGADLNSSSELDPSHIDPGICTHIIVGFASVVNSTISLIDGSEKIYESIGRLKNRQPGLKVMISAAGMDELRGGFPEMVENHANRKRFIRSVLNVTKFYNLDGLDIDWEFPVWLGANGRQKIYFVQLLQELRKEFDRSGRQLLLSVAVAAPAAIIDQSYNVPAIAEHVDFVSVMTYDYHFYVWYFPVTGHNSPLYPRNAEMNGYVGTLNVNYSAMYWLSKGMPREKIVIGIPTYGHSFELDNSLNHDVQAPAKGFGKLGQKGFVSYQSVCEFIEKEGATRRYDNESRVPYVYKGNEWISYDDPISVRQKADWIKTNGFRGAMLFSLNEDDWDRKFSNETFPLTRSVLRALSGSISK